MNRQEKVLVVELLKNYFANSKASFVVGLQGLTVKEMESLRKALHPCGGKVFVAKARLAKIAAKSVPAVEGLPDYCKNQIGLVFADEEPPVVAKTLYNFSKKHAALSLIAGCLDAQLVNSESIVRIANLPSRDVLLAQLCGTIKAPISRLVCALNQVPARLVWALNDLSKKEAVVIV